MAQEIPNIELLLYRVDQQDVEIRNCEAEIKQLKEHIQQQAFKQSVQEKRQLIAGISFLGSIIMTLAAVIWSYRHVIFAVRAG